MPWRGGTRAAATSRWAHIAGRSDGCAVAVSCSVCRRHCFLFILSFFLFPMAKRYKRTLDRTRMNSSSNIPGVGSICRVLKPSLSPSFPFLFIYFFFIVRKGPFLFFVVRVSYAWLRSSWKSIERKTCFFLVATALWLEIRILFSMRKAGYIELSLAPAVGALFRTGEH